MPSEAQPHTLTLSHDYWSMSCTEHRQRLGRDLQRDLIANCGAYGVQSQLAPALPWPAAKAAASPGGGLEPKSRPPGFTGSSPAGHPASATGRVNERSNATSRSTNTIFFILSSPLLARVSHSKPAHSYRAIKNPSLHRTLGNRRAWDPLFHFGGWAIMARHSRFRPVSFAPPSFNGFSFIGGRRLRIV